MQAYAETTSGLAAKAEDIQQNVAAYETKLTLLQDSCEKLEKEIEGLLPGAASAGLASAFKERKDSFKIPKRVWGGVFVGCMAGLLGIAMFDPITMQTVELTTNNIGSYILSRIPFAVPFVWLALYSNRRHTEVLRLEEDYAHKESLSKSFQGYKKQFEKEFMDMTASTLLITEPK